MLHTATTRSHGLLFLSCPFVHLTIESFMLQVCACSVMSVWERAPVQLGQCSMLGRDFQHMYTHHVCSFHPSYTTSSLLYMVLFPSSSIKHWELYRMGIGTKILNFFPDQKGKIPVHDKTLYSPSPRVLFVFLWNGNFHRFPTIQFCFSNSVIEPKSELQCTYLYIKQ